MSITSVIRSLQAALSLGISLLEMKITLDSE